MAKQNNQRELILDAAYRCITKKGYANSSLRDIAKEADVTLSQLHYYFGNKKDLFFEVVKKVTHFYQEELKQYLKANKSKHIGISHISEYLKYNLENTPDLYRLIFDLSSLSLTDKKFQVLMTEFFNDTITIIEMIVIDNPFVKEKLTDFSSKNISKMLLGTLLGTALQYILNPEENIDLVDSMDILHAAFE